MLYLCSMIPEIIIINRGDSPLEQEIYTVGEYRVLLGLGLIDEEDTGVHISQ